MATIKQIAQDVALLLNYNIPSSFINSTDLTARQLLSLINEEGRFEAGEAEWPQLMRMGYITLVDAQAEYSLPADFYCLIPQTIYDNSSEWPLIPYDPQTFQYELIHNMAQTMNRRFIIGGASAAQMLIQPTPTASDAGVVLTYLYRSKNWIRPKTWTASTVFAAGAYCYYDGNYYSTVSGGTTGSTAPTHTDGSQSDGGVTWDYQDILYDQALADTDCSKIDDEILKLGLKWRFLKTKRLDFSVELQEYNDRLDKEKSRLSGNEVLNFRSRPKTIHFIDEYNIPDNV